MEIKKEEVSRIVEEVVRQFHLNGGAVKKSSSPSRGLFDTVDEAVEMASLAQRELMKLSLEKRGEIIEAMRRAAEDNARELAELAVSETGMGRISDKMKKIILQARKTPGLEDIPSRVFTGDRGLTLIEMAPYGVIGAITPSTNPGATVINNSIGMVAAGNSVVFGPHPGARRVSQRALQILGEAVEMAGGPANLLTTVREPSMDTGLALMKHPGIRLLVVTGGPVVVRMAMDSGKKVIAAGPGNPPVVVDETADIAAAARDIVLGASFDNNVMCISEKNIFAVESIADELKLKMQGCGGFLLSPKQMEDLTVQVIQTGTLGHPEPTMNKNYVGKDPALIAKAIGLDIGPDVHLLFGEVAYDHPLVSAEQMMPLIPLVRVRDVKDGIEKAVKAEHGFRHTAMMHSRNIEHLSLMAKMVDSSIFVKNAPSYSGLGFGGEGYTSMTIASPTGEGITSARTFGRFRRCTLVDYFRIV
ncbi:MAG: aldehyde dehydrogenase family protein [bacterium]